MNDFLLQGLPIVTSDEMVRLEKLSYAKGALEEEFMTNAGRGVADAAEAFILKHKLKRNIYLLIGKGNKGGDAFTAGTFLLEKGFSVIAYCLFPQEECSSLNQSRGKQFKNSGGLMIQTRSEADFQFQEGSLILDGLLGTGFHGKVEGVLALAIKAANHSKLPILAIDIPSGVSGNTGAVESSAIQATKTLYLGLPKWGFFVGQGWNYAGRLSPIDFGLAESFIKQALPQAYLINFRQLADALPLIKRTRHKYEAGYLLCIAGSIGMSGAAIMAAWAALRAGAGIVRLFHPEGMELSGAPLELLEEKWDLKDPQKILVEAKRAKAFIIGPGIGRAKETEEAAKKLLKEIQLPCVLDADLLYFLAQDPKMQLPLQSILTPHKEEMKRLLGGGEPTLDHCQNYVEKKKVTLVLKGAPTFVLHPESKPIVIPFGDPGMATAGSGDVLTGIIGALLAQGMKTRAAAVVGVALHGLAGQSVAAQKNSRGLMATDLINELPTIYKSLKNSRYAGA